MVLKILSFDPLKFRNLAFYILWYLPIFASKCCEMRNDFNNTSILINITSYCHFNVLQYLSTLLLIFTYLNSSPLKSFRLHFWSLSPFRALIGFLNTLGSSENSWKPCSSLLVEAGNLRMIGNLCLKMQNLLDIIIIDFNY